MTALLLLICHALATWFMTGLIWFVQIVHYRLFDHIGAEGYRRYQASHVRLTTPVVGPPMLIEATTALALLKVRPPGLGTAPLILGLALLAGIWLSTATLQVPAHRRLATGFDPATHRRLLRTNWLRTGLWTARGLLTAWMLLRAGSPSPA